MKINKSIVGWLLAVCVLAGIVVLGFKCHDIAYTAYANEPLGTNEEHVIELVVEEGDRFTDIAEELKKNKLLDSTVPFVFRSIFSAYRTGLKPGTYEISETMGIDDILSVVTQSEE